MTKITEKLLATTLSNIIKSQTGVNELLEIHKHLIKKTAEYAYIKYTTEMSIEEASTILSRLFFARYSQVLDEINGRVDEGEEVTITLTLEDQVFFIPSLKAYAIFNKDGGYSSDYQ